MTGTTALLAGVAAGLGVAMPLGPIGVLILQRAVRDGQRAATPAAAGVAVVDTLYCVAALALGRIAAPVLVRLGSWPATAGGVVLVVLAARGLFGMRRSAPAGQQPDRSPAAAGRTFLLFLGLTLINPATLAYFAAITAGLSELTETWWTAALFTVAVAVASLAWQLSLALIGHLLGGRLGHRGRRVITLLGHAAVGVFGLVLLCRAQAFHVAGWVSGV